MPNIIKPRSFELFINALLDFIVRYELDWKVYNRGVFLQEQWRFVTIVFDGTILFPEDMADPQSVLQILGELGELIGNHNGSLQTPYGASTYPAVVAERPALDVVISYKENHLTDRQIAEFKEKRFV